MIGLNEDRKLELIEECKMVMKASSPDGNIYPIYEMALKVLQASPKAYLVGEYHVLHWQDPSVDSFCNAKPLYLAPALPAFNLPDDDSCEEGLKKHGLRTKEEGVSQLSDGFRCGFAWYEHVMKRLNGSGD